MIDGSTIAKKIALCLAILALVWLTFWYGGVNPVESWVGAGLLMVSVIITCGLILKGSYQLNFSWNIFIGIALAFVCIVWRACFSEVSYFARKELVSFGFIFAGIFVFYFNIAAIGLNKIARNIVCLGFLLSAYLLCQYIAESKKILWVAQPVQYHNRYSSVFINPNHCSAFLSCVLPFSVVRLLDKSVSRVRFLSLMFVSISIAASIIITLSRGGVIAASLGIIVVLLINYRRWFKAVLIISIAVSTLILFISINNSGRIHSRLVSIVSANKPDSGLFRYWLWAATIDMWRDNKWFGVGLGQFQVTFNKYRPGSIPLNPEFTHNEFLNVLVEMGVIGVLVLLPGVWYLLVHPLKINIESLLRFGVQCQSNGGHKLACVGAVVAGLVALFFDYSLHIPAFGLLFSMVVGINLLFGESQSKITNRPAKLIAWLCKFIAVILGVGVLWWGAKYLGLAREDYHLRYAQIMGHSVIGKIDQLNQARRAIPDNPITYFLIGEEMRNSVQNLNQNNENVLGAAIGFYNMAVKIDPHFARAWMSLGMAFEKKGDLENSYKYMLIAHKNGVNDVFILNNYSRLLIALGRKDEAKLLVEQSLSINWWNNSEAVYFKNLIDFGR